MRKLLFILAPLTLVFGSCGPEKVPEGEVEYLITYPNLEISGFMRAILPETMTISFKGTKMKTTIASGEIFSTEIISDEKDKSIEMRLDFGDKLYYSILDENDIKDMIASQPVYTINPLNVQDSVAGMYATSYAISCENDTIERADAWFTEDLAPVQAYWFSAYASLTGFPLIYDVERYGVLMHLEAQKLTKREVKVSEFERDPVLEEVSFKQYEEEVQELFDTLID